MKKDGERRGGGAKMGFLTYHSIDERENKRTRITGLQNEILDNFFLDGGRSGME